MIKQGYGHIVNTASVCGIVPLPYRTVYAASKYAVVGFGEDFRHEMSFHNIKVTTVCPGAVDTMIFYRSLDYAPHGTAQTAGSDRHRSGAGDLERGGGTQHCARRGFRARCIMPSEPTLPSGEYDAASWQSRAQGTAIPRSRTLRGLTPSDKGSNKRHGGIQDIQKADLPLEVVILLVGG